MTDRVGLVIGADASQFRREMQGASREIEKLDKVLGRGAKKGVFSKNEAKDYDRQLQKTNQSVNRMALEYKRVTNELRLMEAEKQKLLRTDRQAALQMSQQIAALKTHARSSQHALATAQGRVGAIQAGRAGVGAAPGAMGSLVSRFAPLAMGFGALGMASRLGSWYKGKMDAGETTLIQNSLARMGSERQAGFSPRDGGWKSSRRGVERYGRSMGYSTAETHKIYQESMKSAGTPSATVAKHNIALMRGYNMDSGTVSGYMQAQRQSGGIVGGADPQRNLIRGLNLGGFSRTLSTEMARAVTGILQSTSNSRERTPANLIPGLVGMLSRNLGGAYKQSPQRTAALLGGLHGTISAPSGGEAGEGFMLRAMGYGKDAASGGVGYFKARLRMEQGITGKGNIGRVLGQLHQEVQGTDEMKAMYLNKLSGGKIALHQSLRLVRMKKITKDGIDAAMSGKGDLYGEADKTKSRTGLVRMKIGMAEKQAQVRAGAQDLYKFKQKVEMQLLTSMNNALQGILAILKGDWKNVIKLMAGKKDPKVWAAEGGSPIASLIAWWVEKRKNESKPKDVKRGRNK